MTFLLLRIHHDGHKNSSVGKKLLRIKVQSIFLLSTLLSFILYSHNVGALERFHDKSSVSLGIYPRGGAKERGFTDVLHISPPTQEQSQQHQYPYHPSPRISSTTNIMNQHDSNVLHPVSRRDYSTNNGRRMIIIPSKEVEKSASSRTHHHDMRHGKKMIRNIRNIQTSNMGASTTATTTTATSHNPSGPLDSLNKGQYVLMRNDPLTTSTTSSSSSSVVSSSSSKKPSPTASSSKNTEPSSTTGQPLIYRYFARSRTRTGSDSIPFIILGPSVDHWKTCGKILASRGFNVMAVERVKNIHPPSPSIHPATTTTTAQTHSKQMSLTNGPPATSIPSSSSSFLPPEIRLNEDGRPIHEGEALITAVLDALKWQRAVLVGCDEESILLIEAAMRMAPDRVAGLVLCGDLQSVEKHIEKLIQNMKNQGVRDDDSNMDVDSFLEDFLDCPTSIIWGGNYGDDRIIREPEVDTLRSVIIGGGLAPHRRLPEQFAWTLSRFVENKVSPHSAAYEVGQRKGEDGGLHSVSDLDQPQESRLRRAINYTRYHSVWKEILPESVTKAFDEIFAPGSLLVTGRVIAFAVMYMSLARVSLFQYRNLKDIPTTILSAKNVLKLLVSVPGLLFRRRSTMDQDEDGPVTDSGGNVLFQDEIDENEKLKDKLVESTIPNNNDIMEENDVDDKNKIIPPGDDHKKSLKNHEDIPLLLEDSAEDEENERHVNSHEEDDDSSQDLKHFFFDQIVS